MKILDNIAKVKILVVGDVMLDRYWWGSVHRISPEAPVPIVQLEETSTIVGGAANVAANLAGLGATPFLIGVKGDDREGAALDAVLADAGVANHFLHSISGRRTTIKTRIVAHSQHVVRIDQESVDPIAAADSDDILSKAVELLPSVDALIISDYAKGLLTASVLKRLISVARSLDKLIVVDPKGRDFSKYVGATVITPNKREAAEAGAMDLGERDIVNAAGTGLMESLNLKALLITEGENGMTLFRRSQAPHHLESLARKVYDVTGAGDTVIAAFTAAAAAGHDFLDAAELANVAAGIAVGQIGTTRVTAAMLREQNDPDMDNQFSESLHA